MGVTQSDIAKAANVSRSAVALALNGIGRQNIQTRDRILKIADEMGYRPNMLVRGIRTGKTKTIGVLMNCGEGFFGRVCAGIQYYLWQYEYVPIIVPNSNEDGIVDLVHSLVDRRVEGCIIHPDNPESMDKLDNVYVSEIGSRDIPMVVVDNQFHEDCFADFCGTDDFKAGCLAAEHLISLGHKNLAWLYADDSSDGSLANCFSLRREGFKSVVDKKASVRLTDIDLLEDGGPVENIINILDRPERPSAIAVGNDNYVVDVYRSVEKLGLVIPEDVSVVGFGDHEFLKYISPAITTVNEHPYQIGCDAAKMLLDRINNTVKSRKNLIVRRQPELIDRQSTAKV